MSGEQAAVASRSSEGMLHQFLSGIPRGRPLPNESWQRRHRVIVVLVFLHAIGFMIASFLWGGDRTIFYLAAAGAIAAMGALALLNSIPKWGRAALTTLGLTTSSAVLVMMSGGYIEMHFHFFVVVAVVALYQSWTPFLIALGVVVLEHGIAGVSMPGAVYNHHQAVAHPWVWALIHAVFVLGLSAVCVYTWGMNEQARALTQSMLNAIDDGIVSVGGDGRITFVNPAAERQLGWIAQQLTGRQFHHMVCADRLDSNELSDANCPTCSRLYSGSVYVVPDGRLLRRGSTPFKVEFVITPLRGSGASGAMLSFRELTDARATTSAFRIARAMSSGLPPAVGSEDERRAG